MIWDTKDLASAISRTEALKLSPLHPVCWSRERWRPIEKRGQRRSSDPDFVDLVDGPDLSGSILSSVGSTWQYSTQR